MTKIDLTSFHLLSEPSIFEKNKFSLDITQKTLNSCTTILERGSSFADSAYGTDDQTLVETTSLTDYYSDPFSSALTPVKDFGSSPIKKTTTDQLPKRMYAFIFY
jgi:hypothetical protein